MTEKDETGFPFLDDVRRPWSIHNHVSIARRAQEEAERQARLSSRSYSNGGSSYVEGHGGATSCPDDGLIIGILLAVLAVILGVVGYNAFIDHRAKSAREAIEAKELAAKKEVWRKQNAERYAEPLEELLEEWFCPGLTRLPADERDLARRMYRHFNRLVYTYSGGAELLEDKEKTKAIDALGAKIADSSMEFIPPFEQERRALQAIEEYESEWGKLPEAISRTMLSYWNRRIEALGTMLRSLNALSIKTYDDPQAIHRSYRDWLVSKDAKALIEEFESKFGEPTKSEKRMLAKTYPATGLKDFQLKIDGLE